MTAKRTVRLLASVAAATVVASLPAWEARASSYPRERTSPDRRVVVVTVNAKQLRFGDAGRLRHLAGALRSRPKTSAGRYLAPDAIIVQEIGRSGLDKLRRKLNRRFRITYRVAGTTAVGTHSKFLVNATALRPVRSRRWPDVCVSHRFYQWLRVRERSSGRALTLAGVHFLPLYPDEDSDECKRANARRLRWKLRIHSGPVIVGGDFNRRPVKTARECDVEETTTPLPWWTAMTATAGDGRKYADAVRRYRRRSGTSMVPEWSWEGAQSLTLCDGTVDERRTRIDYLFASRARVVEARADAPGWAGAEPGTTSCGDDPDCKYSDHRYIWGLFAL